MAEVRGGKNEFDDLLNHVKAMHPEQIDILLNTQKIKEQDYEEQLKNKFTIKYE